MTDCEDNDSPAEGEEPPMEAVCDDYIVGIGASAGGLEPLEDFFGALPEDPGATFVVVQHLSPDFESQMEDILGRRTKLPIHRVSHEMTIRKNSIYLIPPAKTLIISEGKFLLTDKDKESISFPIDTFFRSLAAEAQKSSVGIILSGTGSDGSRGILDVHEAGGLVIAQDEASCKFAGMPSSAIETGVVDLITLPESMPAAIKKYIDENLTPGVLTENLPPPIPASALDIIFDELHRKFGTDFGQYKPNTISRRIQRRVEANGDDDLEAYAERLRNEPEEVEALYQDLLIGVTKFFRDSDAFEKLAETVVHPVVENQSGQVRVWVPGCATGEEAYSIAILFHEEFARQEKTPNLKVFASDIHPDSIRQGGEGRFPEESLDEVDEDLLQRYFERIQGGYQVKPFLRQSVVFAEHNLMTAVPFTRLDLISCRNLLIYFQLNAQKKVFSLFHFGLRMGGYLMLGPSESLGEVEEEFTVVDKHWKIFQKRRDSRAMQSLAGGGSRDGLGLVARRTEENARTRFGTKSPWERTLTENDLLRAYDSILAEYMPRGFLVDDRFRLVHTFAGAESLLRLRSGRTSQFLADLIHDDLRASVSGALQHCAKQKKEVIYNGLTLHSEGDDKHYKLRVKPFRDKQSAIDSFVLTFEEEMLRRAEDGEVEQAPQSATSVVESFSLREELETELRFTKENLQATIEELETSNEELQASNEELVASNEELQSSNEELHSVNEELDTVNSEYQKKIVELTELTDDTDNLLSVTDIEVIFLDRELCIRKFTPQVEQDFRIIQADVGRDIRSFQHNLQYDGFEKDLEAARKGGPRKEKEIVLEDGRVFLVRISPYTSDSGNEGPVLSLVEITSVRQAEQQVSDLSDLVESSNDAIIGFSSSGVITAWNRGAEALYGYNAEEAIGQSAIEFLVPLQEASGFMRKLQLTMDGDHVDPSTSSRLTRSGNTVTVSYRLSTATKSSSSKTRVSSIERDITDEVLVRQDRRRLASVLEETGEFVGISDERGKILFINRAGLALCGYEDLDEAKGMSVSDLHPPEAARRIVETGLPAARKDGMWRGETEVFRQDGRAFAGDQVILYHGEREGDAGYFSTIIRDLTSEREAFAAIEKSEKEASMLAGTLGGVIDHLPEMLVVVDAEQNMMFASPETEHFLEKAGGGKLPLGLDEIVNEAIRTGEPYLPEDFEGVERYSGPDGKVRFYLRRVNLVKLSSDQVSAAIITIHDVTEFHLLDDLKTSLIGTVSHELKNPVAAVLMSLSLIDEGSLGELTPRMAQVIKSTLNECHRINHTIESLLDLTRFEEGARTVDSQVFKVRSLMARCLNNQRLSAGRRDIELVSDVHRDCDIISCDRDRIVMVLDNLVSNAIKHSPEGGKVFITAEPDEDEVVFTVRDHGPGISDEHADKVFTKFFRVPGNNTEGTGLGLNIARQFVEAHGGSIHFENDSEDGGAVFSFRLPASSQKAVVEP